MCIVSMIFDRYNEVWPQPRRHPYVPDPDTQDIFRKEAERMFEQTQRRLTLETQKSAVQLFQEIVALTKKLDTLLGLEDCEDPKKMEWLDKIKQQIIDAEKKKVEDQLII